MSDLGSSLSKTVPGGTYRETINYRGITLDCEFVYYADLRYAEFNNVMHKGECIWTLLGEEHNYELARLCIQQLHERAERD